jgi:hypothetical protein
MIHLLDKRSALDFVRDRRELFDTAGRDNPFACSEWLLHFIDQIARDDWTIVAPERTGDGRSAVLLFRDPAEPHRLKALTNYYASLYSPLISSALDRAAALDALAGDLVSLHPAPTAISFAPLDADSPDTTALRTAFARRSWYVRRHFCFGNWYLPCDGLGFEAYMSGRDSRLYNTWTRKARRFQKGQDGARLELVTEPVEVDAAMSAYERVYARSWKTAEPYPDFVRGWARVCARNGWLRLGIAWLGATPIAAQFWFTMQRRAYIFKLAYDEEHTKLSAGTVLSAFLFQHSLEHDKVVEIDYLTGDDAYKRSWMSHRRERIGLLACNTRTARGLVLTAAEYAGALRQRWRPPVTNPLAAGGAGDD